MFCLQFALSVSIISIHIRAENMMMHNLDGFSFFESAVIDRIYHDLLRMDYGDFQLSSKDYTVSVTYDHQSAVLDFSGAIKVKMLLTFDDLIPCFIDYNAISQ